MLIELPLQEERVFQISNPDFFLRRDHPVSIEYVEEEGTSILTLINDVVKASGFRPLIAMHWMFTWFELQNLKMKV